MSPSFAPVSMNAAITRVYAVIASWTPWIVVSRSATIWLIDTFMTLLSSTITNCAAARTAIGIQAIGAGAGRSAATSPRASVTRPSHAEARAVERPVVPALAARALCRFDVLEIARVRLAQDPVQDRPEHRQDQHDQQPRDGLLRAEAAADDVHDADAPHDGDRDGDGGPDQRAHAAMLRGRAVHANGARRCPAGVCAPGPGVAASRALPGCPHGRDVGAHADLGAGTPRCPPRAHARGSAHDDHARSSGGLSGAARGARARRAAAGGLDRRAD